MHNSRKKYKRKNGSNRSTTYIVIAIFGISAIALVGFNHQSESHGTNTGILESAYHDEDATKALEFLGTESTETAWESTMDTMPSDGCQKIKINNLGMSLPRLFNDSNHVHYAEAEQIGIPPIKSDADLAKIATPVVRVRSNKNFYVYPLEHSFPYLVPLAAERLNEVGERFNDSLQSRGGGDYRLKVTSMLRTSGSVRRLRRVNRVAVDSSVHRFGTTFDISYTRFMLDKHGGIYRTQEDLKNLLAEVLYAMRNEGKIYVKFERSTGCFHITARQNK